MSFLLETIRLGLWNLRLHLLRSVLTSLGIILGVGAVIIMVSIGEGSKQAALREIQQLGATNVIVRSTKPPESGNTSGEQRSFLARYGITRLDLRRLETTMTEAIAIVPLKSVGDELSYHDKRMISQAFGTTPRLQSVANLRVARGRYLTEEDIIHRLSVAVIGAEVAEKFFVNRDPIESDFRIGSQVFRVIGVLEPVGLAGGAGSSLVGRDWNKDVHIPITTAEIQFGDITNRRSAGAFQTEEVQLAELFIASASTENVVRDAEMVRRLIDIGGPTTAPRNDVQIVVPWELLESAKRQAAVWNIVLTFVAGISLLVGGIGIMNIMLASVTERTREIGIRRALGATRKHIIMQFLVETGSLSSAGGIIGVLLGITLSIGLEALFRYQIIKQLFDTSFQLETDITMWSVALSFFVGSGVGLVFGIYPAVMASRQDPVVALRHD